MPMSRRSSSLLAPTHTVLPGRPIFLCAKPEPDNASITCLWCPRRPEDSAHGFKAHAMTPDGKMDDDEATMSQDDAYRMTMGSEVIDSWSTCFFSNYILAHPFYTVSFPRLRPKVIQKCIKCNNVAPPPSNIPHHHPSIIPPPFIAPPPSVAPPPISPPPSIAPPPIAPPSIHSHLTLHHSLPSPLPPFTTPSLHHSLPSPLPPFTTPSLHHSLPSPLPPFTTPSLHHSLPSPLPPFTTPSLLHHSFPLPPPSLSTTSSPLHHFPLSSPLP
ncbi:uncharacterized protein LACBIDRAFT_328528 [Laccaria bicolor S238N-H82]|uniref:Predicted protein n=1 Tax=Laccaria bicolor (strain S238N-H82 / ATCC MYA-4686) TaxID=486041 RepID=B0DF58_LACBS|nr:uncharacterized protein LACBIDRAFT_328528 [Laccaria bicolor S238N-H82]EDR06655.1 predicted protein [Laccaria bicolor S238N-H82]|eukprot:XP_001882502.1 predicted protein [Laccaria bicolor S238N-H82]